MTEIFTNADPQELAKFAELSHAWWNPQGELKTLHEINPLRLQFIQQHVNLRDQKLVDVGCGGGILSEACARAGAIVNGVDLEARAIAAAKIHSEQMGLNIHYFNSSVEQFADNHSENFSVLTCMELLEHVPNPAHLIAQCARLALPGAKLFFSTINRSPKAYLQAVLGAEYILRLLPKGTHDYAKFIQPAELAAYARKSGLNLMASAGIQYHPLSRNYSLTDSLGVNYMMCFEKC